MRAQRMIRRSLIVFLFVVGSFQACGYMHAVDIQNATSLSSTTLPPTTPPPASTLNFNSVSNQVFSSKCVSCHSGTSPAGNYNLSTYNGTMTGGRIIPNDPANSLLVQRLLDGSMPPGGGLSQDDISLIEDWIAVGAPETTQDNAPVVSAGPDKSIQLPMVNYSIMGSASSASGISSVQWQKVSGPTVTLNGANTLILTLTNLTAGTFVFQLTATDGSGVSSSDLMTLVVAQGTATPTPTPTATPKSTPTPTPTPNQNAKYSLIYANILKPKCESCHDASAPGGLDVRTYSGTIKTVVPFNSAKSTLYTSVASGSMPKGSTKLTASQIQAIKDWIDTGALNN